MKSWGVDVHKLPPNETDQVQPIDCVCGLGARSPAQVKIYLGNRWTSGWMTTTTWQNRKTIRSRPPTGASCWPTGTWYFKAVKKALEGEAKRKYFEHAGAVAHC